MKKFLVISLFLLIGCQNIKSDQANSSQDIEIDKTILPNNYQVVGFSECPINNEDLQTIINVKNGILIPDSDKSSNVDNISLSVPQMNEWLHTFNHIDSLHPPVIFDSQSNRQVYFFIFDGTWNDKDSSKPKTIPAEIYKELINLSPKDSRINVQYYSGVGTKTTSFGKLQEGISGKGSKERAIKALAELKNHISTTNQKPHIYAIGFSRGAATARHFLNLVDDYYFQNTSSNTNSLFSTPRLYSMLFDTVATGQVDALKLEIPNTVTSTIHFVAASEERLFFPIIRLNKKQLQPSYEEKLVEIDLPGVHSDIGGGNDDELEKLAYTLASKWLGKQGIYLPNKNKDVQSILNLGMNDSRWLKLGEPNSNAKRTDITKKALNTLPSDHYNLNFNQLMEPYLLSAMSAKQEYLKQVKDLESGKKKTFQGLVINLFLNNNILSLQTNCPNYVSVNKDQGIIEVLNKPFIWLTPEYLEYLGSNHGAINTYPPLNKENFVRKD
ncbi:T6SS phospholipase effector Tle1-like catalytic domain-containing protein [Shewanella sp. 10N.286.48.A6]|uniref:T6SS phospholipase effector Tle1-like catalytic domain-containing protein n=1 Tax=Shewanella sp. 10N.286.48.A6 TaxID=1880833 RepID=UPI000C84DB2A|nr:DUF2235 domain-containing protein [Shewanella sp. 10N.286.48.A6]PMH94726.1 hypothetical protein BCU55_03615 [Shewanella sp. 10N.286.48.A6]